MELVLKYLTIKRNFSLKVISPPWDFCLCRNVVLLLIADI